ncbi:MAG: C4-type zinc ribbon domain-containing protein [Phycisphaerales bacterium]|nr:C4-type zinc ribbon domain-containing protein [Phycisphaerales bacterium]
MTTTKSIEVNIPKSIAQLIALQKLDTKIDDIEMMKGTLPQMVEELKKELNNLKAKKHNFEAEINGINEFIVTKKTLVKDGDAILKKYEKQSDNIKNNREFESINKQKSDKESEIKLTQREIVDAEVALQAKIRGLESVNKIIAEKESLLKHKEEELNGIIKENEKDIIGYTEAKSDCVKKIDKTILDSYTKIRNAYQNKLVVVNTNRESCGGCFCSIPPQKLIEIRKQKKIVSCEYCGRILVNEDDE